MRSALSGFYMYHAENEIQYIYNKSGIFSQIQIKFSIFEIPSYIKYDLKR